MTKPTLTARQNELLEYLRHYQRENGLMPSTREIQTHFGFASQTAAISHLRALEKKGTIRRLAGKARAVIVPDERDHRSLVTIGVFGTIPAGLPSGVEPENEGTVTLDPTAFQLSGKNAAFALKVRGESMIGAHICPGDLVILESREPRDGDVVAALIDGETTLKRFVNRDGAPYLKAENADFPDLVPAVELVVQGVMVGLMRGPIGRAA